MTQFFVLRILADLGTVKPIIHNEKIISINFSMDEYSIIFRDSQQMLIASLRNLAKSFGVETQKSIFPYNFVNENNLEYIGKVPDLNFFNNLSMDTVEYSMKFLNKSWSLRDETIKYCENDCIALYQILIKFNSMIFEIFSKSIHKYPTLPSLAFAIFRSNFMENENIPKLSGNISKDIRESYTGGSTDIFIPKGENIKCYDVNSLYPSVMIDQVMPTGKIESFNGNIRKFDKNAFGFFYVKVNCPEDIIHPIIQIKQKTDNGIKTISPVGTWSMWIF